MTPIDDGASAARLRQRLVAAGLVMPLIVGGGVALHGPALPLYAERFGLTEAGAALIVTAHWVGAFTGVTAMMLGVRMGARFSIAAFGLGALAIALWQSWTLALLGAALLGAGQGISSAVFNTRLLAEFGRRGAALVGLSNAAYGLGAILSPLLLVALGNAPDRVFQILVVIAALLWPLAPATPRATGPTASLAGLGARLRRGAGVLSIGAFCVGVEAALAGLGPAGLMATGTDQTRAAVLQSGFFVAFLLARLAFSWASLHMPAERLLLAGAAGLALSGLGAATLAPEPFFVLAGACTGILFPAWFVAAAARLGSDPQGGATLVFAAIAGGTVLPAGITAVIAASGAAALFWVVGAAGLILTLLVGRLLRA